MKRQIYKTAKLLPEGLMLQDSSRCRKSHITKPYYSTVFHTDRPMVKFNLDMRHGKRLKTITRNEAKSFILTHCVKVT